MPKALAIIDDLFFAVKVMDAAKRAGLELVFAKTRAGALVAAANRPAVVILDLNLAAVDPVSLASELKKLDLPVIAYVSHVQVDLKRAAEQAGCDRVYPRSAFSLKMAEILAAYAA